MLVAVAGGAVGIAWGALAYDGVQQEPADSRGLVASGIGAGTTDGTTPPQHRVGQGALLLDLRTVRLAPRAHLRVRARADTDDLVVALPEGTCERLIVHVRPLGRRPQLFDRIVRPLGLRTEAGSEPVGVANTTELLTSADESAQQQREHTDGLPPLVAFGRVHWLHGTWLRTDAVPAARPTIEITAQAAQQVIVRDYPARLSPGALLTDAAARSWPSRDEQDPQPLQPYDAPAFAGDSGRWLRDTAADRRRVRTMLRFQRTLRAWAVRQGRRYAGPCATRAELGAQRYAVQGAVFEGPPRTDVRADDTVYLDGLGRALRPVVQDDRITGWKELG
ncbi:MAG: hypothetical protein PGN13_07010 [Patulibacter minatonensis]